MNALAKANHSTSAVAHSTANEMVAMIERAVRDPSVDVAKMRELYELMRMARAENAQVAYKAALSKMQPKLPSIDRNGKIVIKEKNSERVIQSTNYALWEDINDAIKPVLAKHGFALSFRTGVTAEGKLTVTAILSHEEGHQEETTLTLLHDSTGSKNAVQAVGSSTSYGMRYTARALINFTSRAPQDRDDDAQKAVAGPETISEHQALSLHDFIKATNSNIDQFLTHFKVGRLEDLTPAAHEQALSMLGQRAAKQRALREKANS